MQKPTCENINRITDAHWSIEVYHPEIKQTCGIERCQARIGRAQPIFLAISACFQQHNRQLTERISFYQQNWNVIKKSIQQHMQYLLFQTI